MWSVDQTIFKVLRYGRILMRQTILTFLRPVKTFRKQWLWSNVVQFVFGILAGALLGISSRFDYNSEIITTIAQSLPADNLKIANRSRNASSLSNVYIQCIIFIHPKQGYWSNYVQALRGTYTKQCNDTIYVTNSKEIRKKLAEELNVAFVNTRKTHYNWDLYRQILKYLVKRKKNKKSFWTVVCDEQTFIVMANLRKLLALYDTEQPLMFGKISRKRSLLSYLFPLGSYTTIHSQGGIVFSKTAIERMTNDACFGWLSPSATEHALIRCSRLMNVQFVNPTDQEGMYLFNSESLNALVEISNLVSSKKRHQLQCSDQAISFGGMFFTEHWLVDFATKISVFGFQASPQS